MILSDSGLVEDLGQEVEDVGVVSGEGGEVEGGWGLGMPKPPERRTRRWRVRVAIAFLPSEMVVGTLTSDDSGDSVVADVVLCRRESRGPVRGNSNTAEFDGFHSDILR